LPRDASLGVRIAQSLPARVQLGQPQFSVLDRLCQILFSPLEMNRQLLARFDRMVASRQHGLPQLCRLCMVTAAFRHQRQFA